MTLPHDSTKPFHSFWVSQAPWKIMKGSAFDNLIFPAFHHFPQHSISSLPQGTPPAFNNSSTSFLFFSYQNPFLGKNMLSVTYTFLWSSNSGKEGWAYLGEFWAAGSNWKKQARGPLGVTEIPAGRSNLLGPGSRRGCLLAAAGPGLPPPPRPLRKGNLVPVSNKGIWTAGESPELQA